MSYIGNVPSITILDIEGINTVAADLNEPVSEINTVAVNIADINTAANNIAAIVAAPANAVTSSAGAVTATNSATAAAISAAAAELAHVRTADLAVSLVLQTANSSATVIGSGADCGDVLIPGSFFAIENIPSVRVDLALDSGTYEFGNV